MLSNAWRASCRLPDFEYMSTRTFPTDTSFSNPALTMQAWTLLPLSSTARLAQAFRAVLKVTLSGFTPSAKRDYIASLLRPCWSQTEIIAIQEITSLLGSLSNTLCACSTLQNHEYMLTKAFPKGSVWSKSSSDNMDLLPLFQNCSCDRTSIEEAHEHDLVWL